MGGLKADSLTGHVIRTLHRVPFPVTYEELRDHVSLAYGDCEDRLRSTLLNHLGTYFGRQDREEPDDGHPWAYYLLPECVDDLKRRGILSDPAPGQPECESAEVVGPDGIGERVEYNAGT